MTERVVEAQTACHYPLACLCDIALYQPEPRPLHREHGHKLSSVMAIDVVLALLHQSPHLLFVSLHLFDARLDNSAVQCDLHLLSRSIEHHACKREVFGAIKLVPCVEQTA